LKGVLRPGEILALVGENGAGKSTLMNILYGLLPRDSGEISIDGRLVQFSGASEAIRAGVGMVPQHLKLGRSFSVAENIVLGAEPVDALGRLDRQAARRETSAISHRFGFGLDPDVSVGSLPVGSQQKVEILKALYREARILILDEPTAVLTPIETRALFATIRRLAESGRSVIFITHKLREVLAVSDRIAVMRQGRVVAQIDNAGVDAGALAALMIERDLAPARNRGAPRPAGRSLLAVEGLCCLGERGETAIDGLSLQARAGEIVGVAGVQGNGQDELAQCIAGLRHPVRGMVAIDGQQVAGGPRERRRAGLAYIPADRQGLGLSLGSPLWENMLAGHPGRFGKAGFLDLPAARRWAASLIQQHDIRGADPDKPAGSLSGGNAQKVQLARELSRDVCVVVAEQPSQGVDVGAVEAIHRTLVALRDEGRAVLVISSDLDEIFAICDRILVMYRGRIAADRRREETDIDEIGRFIGGVFASHPETQDGVEATHVG